MTTDYKIISSTDKTIFEADVNKRINDGYSLIFGSFQVIYTPNGVLYTQAIYKDIYDEE